MDFVNGFADPAVFGGGNIRDAIASTVPLLGRTMPQTMLMSVVLPAPLGPSSAKISPRPMERLTPLSA